MGEGKIGGRRAAGRPHETDFREPEELELEGMPPESVALPGAVRDDSWEHEEDRPVSAGTSFTAFLDSRESGRFEPVEDVAPKKQFIDTLEGRLEGPSGVLERTSLANRQINQVTKRLIAELESPEPDPYHLVRMMTGLDPARVEEEIKSLEGLKAEFKLKSKFNPKRLLLVREYQKRKAELRGELKYLQRLNEARIKAHSDYAAANKIAKEQPRFLRQAMGVLNAENHDTRLFKLAVNEKLQRMHGLDFEWMENSRNALDRVQKEVSRNVLEYVFRFGGVSARPEVMLNALERDERVQADASIFFRNAMMDNLGSYLAQIDTIGEED